MCRPILSSFYSIILPIKNAQKNVLTNNKIYMNKCYFYQNYFHVSILYFLVYLTEGVTISPAHVNQLGSPLA